MKSNKEIFRNPVARALQILGDRSSMIIIRDLFLGRHRFKEFYEHSNVSKGTLSTRLESLLSEEILYKKRYLEKPPRYEYRLTSKGLALYPWALAIWQWESEWGDRDRAGLPNRLTHKHDNSHTLKPICLCRHCKQPVTISNVIVSRAQHSRNGFDSPIVDQSIGKQRRISNVKESSRDESLGHVIDVIGDRWSSLIVGASLLGLKRFEEFQQELGIAPNILTTRLKNLINLGVLQRTQYQNKPTRYEYRLSSKGKALYDQTMALRQWVLDCFPSVGETLNLKHSECGADLSVDVVCEFCHEVPRPSDVHFNRKQI